MNISSHDVEQALEILDVLPESEVERLRVSINATQASLGSGEATGSAPASPRVVTDPVLVACVFYFLSTSTDSLKRSL
jgi:hypothetical protein